MRCDRCAGEQVVKAGRDRAGGQLWRCTACGPRATERSGSAIRGYHFPDVIIPLAVPWYLRYQLRYCEVAAWLAERGVTVAPSTLCDCIKIFTPVFVEAAQKLRQQVGAKWRVDETLLKISRC